MTKEYNMMENRLVDSVQKISKLEHQNIQNTAKTKEIINKNKLITEMNRVLKVNKIFIFVVVCTFI